MVTQEAKAKANVLVLALRGLIALHRMEKVNQSQSAKADMVRRGIGRAMKTMDDTDKARLKQFSNELQHADLSSSDAVIIETIIRKVTR